MSKTMIVYYSMDGNTKKIAQWLQEATGADCMQIDTVEPYEGSDEEVVRQCEREIQSGFRPALQPQPFRVQDYDTVIVGSPTWWYTGAAPVFTFLEENDWRGKRVVLFQTHCGWPGKGLKDLAAAMPGAQLLSSMAIQFDPKQFGHLLTPERKVRAWIEDVRAMI